MRHVPCYIMPSTDLNKLNTECKMAFTVRTFEEKDAAQVADVMYESFKTVFGSMWEKEGKGDGSYWKQHARSETPTHIVTSFVAVQEDGRVIGFLNVDANLKRGLGILHSIGVDPRVFAQGVGKALVAEAEKFWRQHRMRKIYTCTSHINQRALRFYKSLGFHEEGLLKSHFFDGIDEIQLAKFYKYDD